MFRLEREERLGVLKRGGRKRALETRSPVLLPETATSAGRFILSLTLCPTIAGSEVLAVVDEFMRECLGLVADTLLSGLRVGRELDRIVELPGYRPEMIFSDNGTELTSHAILRWPEKRSVL